MSNYLVIKEIVEKLEITQYALRKAIKQGQVRHCLTKLLPKNITVTMACVDDVKTYRLLTENDFAPIGVISQKYNVHRSTMYYHRSTGAVRWQLRGKHLFLHRQDCESLFAQKRTREKQAS